jgi:hypothetical protein
VKPGPVRPKKLLPNGPWFHVVGIIAGNARSGSVAVAYAIAVSGALGAAAKLARSRTLRKNAAIFNNLLQLLTLRSLDGL